MSISRRLLKRAKKQAEQAKLNSELAHKAIIAEKLNVSPKVDTKVNDFPLTYVSGQGQPTRKAKPRVKSKAMPKMHYSTFVRNYL